MRKKNKVALPLWTRYKSKATKTNNNVNKMRLYTIKANNET